MYMPKGKYILQEDPDMTSLDHIKTLANHGACIKAGDQRIPLTEDFYRKAVEECKTGRCNAITYELELPGIDDEMAVCVWKDGHVDSGSMRSICDYLASR